MLHSLNQFEVTFLSTDVRVNFFFFSVDHVVSHTLTFHDSQPSDLTRLVEPGLKVCLLTDMRQRNYLIYFVYFILTLNLVPQRD